MDIFQRFFERVVDLCQHTGLVWGRELYFDATKVHADAAVDSLLPRFYHEAKAHTAVLFAGETADDEPNATGDDRASPETAPPRLAGLRCFPAKEDGTVPAATQVSEAPWKLLEERRLDPNRPPVGSYRRTTDFRVRATDPDATPMQTGTGAALGYHDHDAVDRGKHRIVLAALVTPADVMENVPLRDLLWRVCFRRKLRPGQVTGDTTYGTTENIVALEDAGIRAFFPLPDFDQRTPFIGKGQFTYDAEADAYRCPQGQPLPRRKTKYTEQEVLYRADAATCNACPVKCKCTTSDHGRMVHRSFFADYLDTVRGYHTTEAYQKAMRKRQIWVEPLFAEAKECHGLRHFRLRGLANVNSEGLLIATGQNLKRFLAATGWGRRYAPCGSLVAVPTPPHWLTPVVS